MAKTKPIGEMTKQEQLDLLGRKLSKTELTNLAQAVSDGWRMGLTSNGDPVFTDR